VSAAHDDHHDDHGHGSPWIQHHYDDAQHQFDSGKLGIWLFLAQEVLFFSALFVAYILYRHHHPEIYAYAHKYLDVKFGAINTAVLIFSSLTAAWAVRAAQKKQQKLLVACLAATLLCALTFLGIKYVEYTHKVHERLLFGRYFDPCVTSGGNPLLNKGNRCPGSKGSVLWNHEKEAPELGCFPVIAIDQKPNQPGVQAECTNVREVPMNPVLDVEGKPVVDWESKTHQFVADEKAAKPIAKTCKPGEDNCWKISHQPAVCRPGWFYTTRCTGGPGFATAKADYDRAKAALDAAIQSKNKKAAEDAAKALQPLDEKWRLARSCSEPDKYWVSYPFADQGECSDGARKRNEAIGKIRKAELEAKCPGPDNDAKKKCLEDHDKDPDLTNVTVGPCVRSEQVGLIVPHHDHASRPENIVVAAQCKAPPKQTEPDWFSDKKQTLSVGAKSAAGEVSHHDDHADRYAGPPPEHTSMFFTIYFAMTGLHGIHVLVGVFIFIWLLIRAVKGHFSPDYFGPIDWAALYWHIVDLIWIFLFPLMYLIH
jgi:heme/copper-type cytochrome/quinol oxidase subunit 3